VLAGLGGDVNKAIAVSVEGVASAVVVVSVACRDGCHYVGCDVSVAVHDCVQGGTTPIYAAAATGHKDCIEMLAGLGGDVNKARTVRVEALSAMFMRMV